MGTTNTITITNNSNTITTNSWSNRWKNRHKIRLKCVHGKKLSADKSTSNDWKVDSYRQF